MDTIIEMKGVNKFYDIDKKIRFQALKNIDLTIKRGEMIALRGRSGAGKTTLLNIIGCIDLPNEGEYFLDNEHIFGSGARMMSDRNLARIRNRKIGFVMQDYILLKDQTVLYNVMLPFFFCKIPYKNMKEKAYEILKLTGIDDQANKKVKQLSGGQKQRVAISRALITDPSIILADEPTGALDTTTAEEIMLLLKEINSKGSTILIATHDENAMSHCQKIISIEDGTLVT
jgi:putative ABC transport system ATP-binding protein